MKYVCVNMNEICVCICDEIYVCVFVMKYMCVNMNEICVCKYEWNICV